MRFARAFALAFVVGMGCSGLVRVVLRETREVRAAVRNAAEMDWTYEPPTQPGHYWVRAAGAPEVVHVSSFAVADDFGLVVWTIGGDDWLHIRECKGWRWWPEALVVPPYESDW